MICNQCGENHAGHCSRMVKQLRAEINELRKQQSLQPVNKRVYTDRREYMREYMRKRRLKNHSGSENG